MFGTIKKAMVAGAVLAVGALGAPTMASAVTATPALPASATQGCVTLVAGGPCVAATRSYSGSATLTSPTGLTVTCNVSVTVDFTAAGTGVARNIVFTPAAPTDCPTNVPTCRVAATAGPAGSDTWGARLITHTNPPAPATGAYLAVNVSFVNNFTSGCPVTGSFTETGQLWFRVGNHGATTAITSASVGAASAPWNSVSNPSLGAATVSGTLNKTAAETSVFLGM